MKRLACYLVFLLGVSGPVFAAAVSATPTPYPTPIYSPAPKLDEGLKKAMFQIQKDLKAKKLTQAQAESFQTQVKAIRKQELADIKANGKRKLTASQEAGLNQQLEQLQGSF